MTPGAEVAQSAERGTENPCVGGSIPSLGKNSNPYLLVGVLCYAYKMMMFSHDNVIDGRNS